MGSHANEGSSIGIGMKSSLLSNPSHKHLLNAHKDMKYLAGNQGLNIPSRPITSSNSMGGGLGFGGRAVRPTTAFYSTQGGSQNGLNM